jgi:hypothetical protein
MRDRDEDVAEDVAELLRRLDHRAPVVRVDDVIARAGSGRRWRAARPIAAAAALCVAGAAAALPGSPLHRAIVRALGIAAPSTATVSFPLPPAPATAQAAGAPDGAGVTVAPVRELAVRFVGLRREARLRIVFTAGAEASIIPRGGDAAFSVAPGGIVVSAGTASDYVLTVPSALPELRVRLDDVVLFRRMAGRVESSARPDDDGSYTIVLTPR